MRNVVFFFFPMGRIVFPFLKRKGKQIHMGISDRDYMREPREPEKPPRPRARVRKADNKPSLVSRIRFWLWNLFKH